MSLVRYLIVSTCFVLVLDILVCKSHVAKSCPFYNTFPKLFFSFFFFQNALNVVLPHQTSLYSSMLRKGYADRFNSTLKKTKHSLFPLIESKSVTWAHLLSWYTARVQAKRLLMWDRDEWAELPGGQLQSVNHFRFKCWLAHLPFLLTRKSNCALLAYFWVTTHSRVINIKTR